jgi:hypothetical protein
MAETGARSKRSFQRPESNCGVAINSACEAFMVASKRAECDKPETCSHVIYLKLSKTDISQNVKSLPRGAEFFLSWRRFFAGPVRHRTDSPHHGESVHRQTWRGWTSRRVTRDCHLSQSSVRSHAVVVLFAEMATPNAHGHWPRPRLTALLLLLWFS